MSKKKSYKLTKRIVDAIAVTGQDKVFWDRDLPGFGVRVHANGRKVFVVQARGMKGQKRVTLGTPAEIPPEQARKKAAKVIDRIGQGLDPFPKPMMTVAELAERYLEGHVAVNCRKSTLKSYRWMIQAHILPALGYLPAGRLNREIVAELHYRLRCTPQSANRVTRLLARMLSYGRVQELIPELDDPCKAVRNYQVRKCERFLTQDEYRKLGRVLKKAEAEGVARHSVVVAIRLLMLTGCRKNEILRLRWDDVDREARELRLRDTKTGPRSVPLTETVETVLDSIPRDGDNPWVIQGAKPGKHLVNIDLWWSRFRMDAGLEDVRLHDLRHSWASRALALGEGLSMIGKLMGHREVTTTARYAHLARDAEKASAAKVGGSIGADLLSGQ